MRLTIIVSVANVGLSFVVALLGLLAGGWASTLGMMAALGLLWGGLTVACVPMAVFDAAFRRVPAIAAAISSTLGAFLALAVLNRPAGVDGWIDYAYEFSAMAAYMGTLSLFLIAVGRRIYPDRKGSLCSNCGYCLIGLPERRCPECGRAF